MSGEKIADRTWTVSGKMAIKYESKGLSLGFVWKQTLEESALLFTAPFGRTLRLIKTDEHCFYENDKGEVFEADSLEELMLREVGWFFPFEKANFWIKGVPYPGEKLKFMGVRNGIGSTRFDQGDWTIHIKDVFPDNGNPRLLVLSSRGIDLRIAISRWEF